MLTISKPMGAAQTSTYFKEHFDSSAQEYYTAGDAIVGRWAGRLATHFGLSGDVHDDPFRRLTAGRHPVTDEPMLRIRPPTPYVNEAGEMVTPLTHRAAWDLVFSAPKSVSLVALVGGDDRVRAAHRTAVQIAIREIEHYAQARLGGDRHPETSGQIVAATFEHDSARPVLGYAAPQLHTHCVVFNVTQTEAGTYRSLQPRELFRSQAFATAVYRNELSRRLLALGYAVDRGPHHEPEIRGLSAEYLAASSPRRQQIVAALALAQRTGAEAAEIAAHATREAKIQHAHDAMRQRHLALAEQFGHEAMRAVAAALAHGPRVDHRPDLAVAAVTYAKTRNIERSAVIEERMVLTDALVRALGTASLTRLRGEIDRREAAGELVPRQARLPHPTIRAWTTPEMIALEQETIDRMIAGRGQHPPIGRVPDDAVAHLNPSQQIALRAVLDSQDRVTALDGVAGAGKTTVLGHVRQAVEREGFLVVGLAPTSRAAQQLTEHAGVAAHTLQRELQTAVQGQASRFYVLDESSLAATVQMHHLLDRMRPHDRVLLVGDSRQHQSVEAGRIYEQLQERGMSTARLDTIVRQREPAYKRAVELLAKGDTAAALQIFGRQGHIHQVVKDGDRLKAVATGFLARPDTTLIVAPDHVSRTELNAAIHTALATSGRVTGEATVSVLVTRQDLTGPDRAWAGRYTVGDTVRYAKRSRVYGLAPGEYARVTAIDPVKNLVTVARAHGTLTYDPARVRGVSIFQEQARTFGVGDRVQFTQPFKARGLANGQIGTVTAVNPDAIRVRLGRREVGFSLAGYAHLDYGYAVTSYSSQGLTAQRVILHLDTARANESVVNQRLAYVALSRGVTEADVYTNDKAALVRALSRHVSNQAALDFSA